MEEDIIWQGKKNNKQLFSTQDQPRCNMVLYWRDLEFTNQVEYCFTSYL